MFFIAILVIASTMNAIVVRAQFSDNAGVAAAFNSMFSADREGANLTVQAREFNYALDLIANASIPNQGGNNQQATLKLLEANHTLQAIVSESENQRIKAVEEKRTHLTLTLMAATIFIILSTVTFAITLKRYHMFDLKRTLDMEIRPKTGESEREENER